MKQSKLPSQLSLLLHRNLSTTPPPPSSDLIDQIQNAINQNHHDFNHDPNLRSLFSSTTLSPPLLLRLLRCLPDSHTALRFFDWLSSIASAAVPLAPSAFEALFELALREPNPHHSLLSLLRESHLRHLPLTPTSAHLLVRSFSAAGLPSDAHRALLSLSPNLRPTRLYNDVLHALLKTSRHRSALDLALQMLDSGARPDPATGAVVFSSLLRRAPHGLDERSVERLVVELACRGVFPDSVQLTQWISRLCRTAGSRRAWTALRQIREMGGVLDAPPFNALLTGLIREGNFDRMKALLAEMREFGIKPTVVTYGILMNSLCKSRQVDKALGVLDKMADGEGGGIPPDTIIFNILIDGLCKVGRQEEGLVLAERMWTQYGCSPNTVTYNCLMDGFCKSGEIDQASKLFEQMTQVGIRPNVVSMNTIVDGMCKNGKISSAIKFYREMCHRGLKGNAVTYSSLIGASLHANNVGKAMELFEEMIKNGNSPDSVTYFTLISGLSQAGRMDDALLVASAMQEAGFHLDVASYNVLISGLCKKKKFDKAYELLKKMEEASIKPDEVTFNTLIAALSKGGDISIAKQVMEKMVEDGCLPTVVTYGALIHGYCKAGDFDEAMKLFRSMPTASVPPSTLIYNILIDFMCKEDNVDAALVLLDEMRVGGVAPTAATYNSVFKGLRDRNWLEKAYELMDEMNEQGCDPDYITMEVLTEWLSAIGETTRLRSFAQGCKVSGSSV